MKPAHAALARNAAGNLEIRRFHTAAEATATARNRELPAPAEIEAVIGRRSGLMPSTKFAQALGISARRVRRQFARGGLPGSIEHGARLLLVPTHLLRLATSYGLLRVERMAKAGQLPSSNR